MHPLDRRTPVLNISHGARLPTEIGWTGNVATGNGPHKRGHEVAQGAMDGGDKFLLFLFAVICTTRLFLVFSLSRFFFSFLLIIIAFIAFSSRTFFFFFSFFSLDVFMALG